MGNAAPACCNSATLSGKRFQINGGSEEMPLPNMKQYKNSYIEGKRIGREAKCIEVTQKQSSQVYIVKKIPAKSMPCTNQSEVGRHCANLESLDHPHVCKFVEGFQDQNWVNLIYERADPETLFDHIRSSGQLKEQDVAGYVRQVTMALACAHAQGLYHGRLSPSKIIMALPMEDDEEDDLAQVKICDMGQVYWLRPMSPVGPESEKTIQAERYFLTPELAAGELVTNEQEHCYCPKGAEKIDMWALGTIIYALISGAPPFAACPDRSILMDTAQNECVRFDGKAWTKASPDAQNAVEMLLKMNPALRLSAHAFLKHPFIAISKTSFPKKKMVTLLNNLRTNANNCDFTRFVIRVIAQQLPADGKQVETVEKAFRYLDTDGDGVISVNELLKGLEKHLQLSKAEQEELFQCVDRDGSGTLNVNEFISATMDQRRAKSVPVLWQVFNAFDKDQGGSIAFDEVMSLVHELDGALSSKEQLKDVCQSIRSELAAVSHNDAIDFEQFVYILQHNEPTVVGSMKMELYRLMWSTCQVDFHKVRHNKDKTTLDRLTAGSRSAYRKNKGRQAKSQSQKNQGEDSERVSARGAQSARGKAKSSNEPAQAG